MPSRPMPRADVDDVNDMRISSSSTMANALRARLPMPTSLPSKYIVKSVPSKARMSSLATLTPSTTWLLPRARYRVVLPGTDVALGGSGEFVGVGGTGVDVLVGAGVGEFVGSGGIGVAVAVGGIGVAVAVGGIGVAVAVGISLRQGSLPPLRELGVGHSSGGVSVGVAAFVGVGDVVEVGVAVAVVPVSIAVAVGVLVGVNADPG